MQKFNINKVTISIIQDTRKSLQNTELYSIKYRVAFKGKKKYFKTGKHLTVDEWKNLYTSRSSKHISIREDIQNGFQIIIDSLKKIFEQRKTFSFELLEQFMGNDNITSIKALFKQKTDELLERDRYGSINAYSDTLNCLMNYTKSKDLFPNNITVGFLMKFEKWMGDKNYSLGTIGMYMRHLRAIMNISKKHQMITNEEYPFGKDKYQIPTYQVEQNTLNTNQIRIVMDEPCKEGSLKQMYRDLWLFCYFGNGMNIIDMCKLKYSNINDGEINFIRTKTLYTSKHKKTIYVTLIPEIEKIISRWGTKSKSGNIFPFLPTNCKAEKEKEIVKTLTKAINQTMSRIGVKHNLGTISANTSRHSYATNLAKSNTDISFISDSLGHTTLKSTQVYFAKSTKEERIKHSQKLI